MKPKDEKETPPVTKFQAEISSLALLLRKLQKELELTCSKYEREMMPTLSRMVELRVQELQLELDDHQLSKVKSMLAEIPIILEQVPPDFIGEASKNYILELAGPNEEEFAKIDGNSDEHDIPCDCPACLLIESIRRYALDHVAFLDLQLNAEEITRLLRHWTIGDDIYVRIHNLLSQIDGTSKQDVLSITSEGRQSKKEAA